MLNTSYFTMKYSFLQNYDFSNVSVHKAMAENGLYRKYVEKHIGAITLDARSSRLMGVENQSLALSMISTTYDSDNDLFEYCVSLYPASRNEFILKFRL